MDQVDFFCIYFVVFFLVMHGYMNRFKKRSNEKTMPLLFFPWVPHLLWLSFEDARKIKGTWRNQKKKFLFLRKEIHEDLDEGKKVLLSQIFKFSVLEKYTHASMKFIRRVDVLGKNMCGGGVAFFALKKFCFFGRRAVVMSVVVASGGGDGMDGGVIIICKATRFMGERTKKRMWYVPAEPQAFLTREKWKPEEKNVYARNFARKYFRTL